MTLDQLLAKAKHLIAANVNAYVDPQTIEMCQSIIDLLGADPGCGFELPVVEPGMVSILDGSDDPQPAYQFTPDEARWFAAALLRAADEADVLKAGGQ